MLIGFAVSNKHQQPQEPEALTPGRADYQRWPMNNECTSQIGFYTMKYDNIV
jgi:hypothetical protein